MRERERQRETERERERDRERESEREREKGRVLSHLVEVGYHRHWDIMVSIHLRHCRSRWQKKIAICHKLSRALIGAKRRLKWPLPGVHLSTTFQTPAITHN